MELAVARPALLEALGRFTDAVSSVDSALPLPNSDWVAADVAAHLLIAGRALEGYVRGDREPVTDVDDVPGSNARRLRETTERDVNTLTKELHDVTDRFLELTDHADAADAAFWHGLDVTVGALYGIYLGELLLHGRDVARAAGRRWPISKQDAVMIFEGAAAVSHAFLDEDAVRDFRATYGLRLRGGPSFTFAFDDGVLTVTDGSPARADCRVSADPRSLVLVVYGRSSQWAQIGRGGLFAYGRKPWLALRFAGLFESV
jgi:uncharacterized protein (TIGR03083 family)